MCCAIQILTSALAEQRAGDQKAETERIAVEMRKVTHRKAGERKQILLPGGVTMSFAWCPPGSFQMGSREGSEDEKPVHQEVLKMGFWMGIHPVTQGQWKAVMGNNPSHFTGSFKSWWLGRRYSGDRRPVEQVSWDDTAKFRAVVKQKSGFDLRLPTEVEWEYACRGGTTTAFYWSSELNGRQANCNGNTPLGTDVTGPYSQQTTPVGYFAREYPHPWGLTDVHGNVYEWCADKYGSYSAGATDNPFWPAFGGDGVIRGGAWDSSAKHCRAAFRCRNGPDYQSSRVGFRLVAVPSGE